MQPSQSPLLHVPISSCLQILPKNWGGGEEGSLYPSGSPNDRALLYCSKLQGLNVGLGLDCGAVALMIDLMPIKYELITKGHVLHLRFPHGVWGGSSLSSLNMSGCVKMYFWQIARGSLRCRGSGMICCSNPAGWVEIQNNQHQQISMIGSSTQGIPFF